MLPSEPNDVGLRSLSDAVVVWVGGDCGAGKSQGRLRSRCDEIADFSARALRDEVLRVSRLNDIRWLYVLVRGRIDAMILPVETMVPDLGHSSSRNKLWQVAKDADQSVV